MGHKDGYVRVRRHGSGHLKVSIEAGDDTIGDMSATLYWIRKEDSDPNDPDDPFTFDPKTPLIFPTGSPFQVIAHTARRVTVAYAGAAGPSQSWKCRINVVDGEKAEPWAITSDGSATIKNH
jgi:hypothetical protein